MRFFIFSLLMLSVVFLPRPAHACAPAQYDKEKIIDDAEFIGVVSVKDADDITHEPISGDQEFPTLLPKYQYRFDVVNAYKGSLPDYIVVFAGDTDCDLLKLQKDALERVVIFKNKKGDYYLKRVSLDWDYLEKESQKLKQ